MKADISNIKLVQLQMCTGRAKVSNANALLKSIVIPKDFKDSALLKKLVSMTENIATSLKGIENGLDDAIANITAAETANLRISRKFIFKWYL